MGHTKQFKSAEKSDDTHSESIPKSVSSTLAPPVKGIQQIAGNQAIQRLFQSSTLYPKLSVNPPDDPGEREADKMADRIISHEGSSVDNKGTIRTQEKKSVNRQVENSTLETLGSGHSLPNSQLRFFETRFGADFSGVRIHTDSHMSRMADRLNAQAFTMGPNIVFAAGQYSPDTSHGKHLLGHELAHVLQQRMMNTTAVQRQPKPEKRTGAQPESNAVQKLDPVARIKEILDDPLWIISQSEMPYLILNGLSVEHMLNTLLALRIGGYLETLLRNSVFATGIHEKRLQAVMNAVQLRGSLSSDQFCVEYSSLLSTVEIEGVTALLRFMGGVPEIVEPVDFFRWNDSTYVIYENEVKAGNSKTWKCNNPGAITLMSRLGFSAEEWGAYPGKWYPGRVRIAVFPDSYTGFLALDAWIRANESHKGTIYTFARNQLGVPGAGESAEGYAGFLAKRLGYSHFNVPLNVVDKGALGTATSVMEGWAVGETYSWDDSALPVELHGRLLYTRWTNQAKEMK